MPTKTTISPEIKLLAVKHSLTGDESLNCISARVGVSRSTLQKWILNYELFGIDGLLHRSRNQRYAERLKREAVESYLSGRMSEEAICKKYQIRSRTQLEKWVSVYNDQKEFRTPGGARKGVHMVKCSESEKKSVVEYCILHNRDYALTANCFGRTYQQVYGWVRKYHTVSANENHPVPAVWIEMQSKKSPPHYEIIGPQICVQKKTTALQEENCCGIYC